MKQRTKGRVYIALCVDDKLMDRNLDKIDEVVELLQENRLILKVIDGWQDYLSSEIRFS